MAEFLDDDLLGGLAHVEAYDFSCTRATLTNYDVASLVGKLALALEKCVVLIRLRRKMVFQFFSNSSYFFFSQLKRHLSNLNYRWRITKTVHDDSLPKSNIFFLSWPQTARRFSKPSVNIFYRVYFR